MVATNRWQVLVLATSLAMMLIAVFSKGWVIGSDLRIGLWSHTEVSDFDTNGQLNSIGMVTGLVSFAVLLGVLLLTAFAWLQRRFSIMRTLVLAGIPLQLLAAIALASIKVPEQPTWTGAPFTIFLVGSMGALIGAAALQEAPP